MNGESCSSKSWALKQETSQFWGDISLRVAGQKVLRSLHSMQAFAIAFGCTPELDDKTLSGDITHFGHRT